MGFPPDQADRLAAYAHILETRAVTLGLISERDKDRVLERHVLDSCRAKRCLTGSEIVVVDIGSGAGLPGVPVAILLPGLHVVLIEPMRKRAAFLEFVVAELGLLNVRVLADRAEDAAVSADGALARAVADAPAAWLLARPLLSDDGCLVYFAGSSWDGADVDRLRAVGATATICDEPRSTGGGPLVAIRSGGSTGSPTSQH